MAIFLSFCAINEGLNRQGATVYLPYYWHTTYDISNISFGFWMLVLLSLPGKIMKPVVVCPLDGVTHGGYAC
jgi:hypothetical protein